MTKAPIGTLTEESETDTAPAVSDPRTDDEDAARGALSDADADAVPTDDGAGRDDLPIAVADSADEAANRPAPKRALYQTLGNLLIVVGLAAIVLTLGITGWNRYREAAEMRDLLSRVSTPKPFAAAATLTASGTPAPPTRVATPAAQPVATASDGVDRSLIAAQPAPASAATPTADPATAATPTDVPTPTPQPRMPVPTRLTIPAIKLDSEIVEVGVSPKIIEDQQVSIWDVAPYVVGHHFSSANPGEGENVVLNGHVDWQGEVFRNLNKVKQGDEVRVQAGDRTFVYKVDEILLLLETGQPLEQRLENAKYIGTTGDERVTLVSCWPYGVDNYRLIVIARPVG